MGRRWVAILAAVVLLGVPAAANGQEKGSIELTGYVGVMLPMSSLANQGDTLKAELSTKPSFAAGVEYWLGGGWGIGVMGGLAQPELVLASVDTLTGFPTSERFGTVDVLHAEATILYRPESRSSATVMRPYFGVGVGIRDLSFDTGSGVGDGSDITGVLNIGAHIELGERVHMRLDLRDLISSFEREPFTGSSLQNELFVQVGLGVGL